MKQVAFLPVSLKIWLNPKANAALFGLRYSLAENCVSYVKIYQPRYLNILSIPNTFFVYGSRNQIIQVYHI